MIEKEKEYTLINVAEHTVMSRNITIMKGENYSGTKARIEEVGFLNEIKKGNLVFEDEDNYEEFGLPVHDSFYKSDEEEVVVEEEKDDGITIIDPNEIEKPKDKALRHLIDGAKEEDGDEESEEDEISSVEEIETI